MIDHPLAPAGPPGVPSTGNVPIRYRPRFTMQEALLLNLLVNAHPGWVSLDEISHQLGRFTAYGNPSRENIMVRVCLLRAKLGDPLRKPIQVISVKQRYAVNGFECDRLVGYAWQDPEHPLKIRPYGDEGKE